uniref:Dolichol-phosphate mannosyltransferase subunit 1 n=1 Tax=Vannella robusta TaxID=1487602 RepID=A0A7S4HR61_9EUKA|mmetsp:Transcript_1458/g.1856  ORF Transcript_1458/g.1856 Transcript_1458/m.1856 type:complete len:256 (+) Transcript_1458:39-806(+)
MAAISLVIPTFREAPNIRPLSIRIDEVLKRENIEYEIVFVDDNSNDGTTDIVDELREKNNIPVRVLVRTKERGLSSAVVHGFKNAKYDVFVVMDADLQHDPEYIPKIAGPILDKSADFVLGSRNVTGGKVEDWPLHRRIISWGATSMARPLTSSGDPMSGFFSIHKKTFEQAKGLNPMGYKIGLELVVRCRCKKVQEVGIVFRDREHGESKLTMKQNLLYLRQLMGLYWFKYPLVFVLLFLFMLAFVYFFSKLLF